MDLIERIFGVSPDAGNGSLELLYAIAAAIAIGGLWMLWKRRHAS